MSKWIANARMYAVTPAVEEAWRALLTQVAEDAGVLLHYVDYPAPQPLEHLWARADLGAVFMCGFPVALELAAVVRWRHRSRGHPGPRGGPSTAPISSSARTPPTRGWPIPSGDAPAGR